MPLVKLEKINHNSSWALWKIEEDYQQLLQKTPLHPDDLLELNDIHHPLKKLEWLSSRAALYTLLPSQKCAHFRIRKDEKGKPFLVDHTYHISLANSFPYGVAIIHRRSPVGIDIEKPSMKLLRVKHKFLNPAEESGVDDDLNKLCVAWAIKEALFKLHGKKQLSLKKNISITKSYHIPTQRMPATLLLDKTTEPYELDFYYWDGFYIVYSFIP